MGDVAQMNTTAVSQIGSQLQANGNEIGQVQADVAGGANLHGAFGSTPLAAREGEFETGVAQLAESINKYHDYLTAFGQSLISAAASYQKIDQNTGHAFTSTTNLVDQAQADIAGFIK